MVFCGSFSFPVLFGADQFNTTGPWEGITLDFTVLDPRHSTISGVRFRH